VINEGNPGDLKPTQFGRRESESRIPWKTSGEHKDYVTSMSVTSTPLPPAAALTAAPMDVQIDYSMRKVREFTPPLVSFIFNAWALHLDQTAHSRHHTDTC
jgi:hypothetical protein